MAKDYVPVKDGKRSDWLAGVKKAIVAQGATYGLSPAEIAQAQQLCDEYIAQITKVYQMKATMKSEVGKKKEMRVTHLQPLRKMLSRMKARPNFNKGTNLGADVWSHSEHLDTDQYRPKLKARLASGHIEVRFAKHGVLEGMQFQVQVGEKPVAGKWQTLPIRFYSPLKYKPEGDYPDGAAIRVWFMSRAVVKDELVGEHSDPISIVYSVDESSAH